MAAIFVDEDEIVSLISADAWMMNVLRAAKSLELPDWWVCAGFVRSKIWDTLHGYAERTPLPDVDLVYYDPARLDETYEKELESKLRMLMPDVPWSVKNEARMHEVNGLPPYSSTVDAISKFPETATALGVMLEGEGRIVLTAPCGIEDALRMYIKPTPYFRENPGLMATYGRRLTQKNWRGKWPKAMVFGSWIVELEAVIGKIEAVEWLAEQGCTSQVRRMVAEGGYILKSATDARYREWLRAEAERLKRNDEEGLPLPVFYGFFEEEDASHLLMSLEKGMTLTAAFKEASFDEKKSMARSFGRFLRQFHDQEPVEALKRGDNWLEDQLAKASVYLERGQADGDAELLKFLISHKPLTVRPTMIHGDCTTDNVLVHEGEVYRFIDVAGMTVGDPRYDESLATYRFKDEPELLDAFYEGYARYRVSEEERYYFYEGLYAFF